MGDSIHGGDSITLDTETQHSCTYKYMKRAHHSIEIKSTLARAMRQIV